MLKKLQSATFNNPIEIPLFNEMLWEKALLKHPSIKRFDPLEIIEFLNKIPVENKIEYDSYLYSPVYYTLTGRRGCWLYSGKKSNIIFCWHPNALEKILIFPGFNEKEIIVDSTDLKDLLNIFPYYKETQLSRIPDSLIKQINDYKFENISLQPVPELVLDWKYPAHILSVNLILALQGKSFEKTRNMLRRIDKTKINIVSINDRNKNDIFNLIETWCQTFGLDSYSQEDLTSPTKKLLELLLLPYFKLDGIIIYDKKKPIAFSIWEKSSSIESPSNVFSMSTEKNITGLSEYLIYSMCERLKEQGVKYFNLGGSETQGLDEYKRKFRPVKSYTLHTLSLSHKNLSN